MNWYRKPTSSGRVINFNSNHLTSHKIGMIFGMLHRAIGLSHEEFHELNIIRVKDILTKNGYPLKFINRCIHEFKNKRRNTYPPEDRSNERCSRFPLIQGLSQKINKCFKDTNMRLVFYNLKKVGDLSSKLKDDTPPLERSGVIYKIPCSCSMCYIGQTGQRLQTRVDQHERDCRPEKYLNLHPNDSVELTALAAHSFDFDHKFRFKETSILDTEEHKKKRNISEMIQIYLHDNTVNVREDTQSLKRIYKGLLSKWKKKKRGRYRRS